MNIAQNRATHRRPPATTPLDLCVKFDGVVCPTRGLPGQRGPDAASENTILLVHFPNCRLRALVHASCDRRPGPKLPDLVECLVVRAELARQVLRLDSVDRRLKTYGREGYSSLVSQQPDGLPPLSTLNQWRYEPTGGGGGERLDAKAVAKLVREAVRPVGEGVVQAVEVLRILYLNLRRT